MLGHVLRMDADARWSHQQGSDQTPKLYHAVEQGTQLTNQFKHVLIARMLPMSFIKALVVVKPSGLPLASCAL